MWQPSCEDVIVILILRDMSVLRVLVASEADEYVRLKEHSGTVGIWSDPG